jgi:putative oxidoreductase
MLKQLLSTSNDATLTLMRGVLGVVFFAHGAQKMFGWFGGGGFEATMTGFTSYMGIPWIFALLAIVAEFFGGLGLILGFLTRIASLGILSVMLVAIFKVHAQFGLFMNWAGNQQGEGFEYHLLAIVIAGVLMLRGAGAWSVDGLLASGRSVPGHPAIGSRREEALARH